MEKHSVLFLNDIGANNMPLYYLWALFETINMWIFTFAFFDSVFLGITDEMLLFYMVFIAVTLPYTFIVSKRFVVHTYCMANNITLYELQRYAQCSYMIANLDNLEEDIEFYNPFNRGIWINLAEFWLPLFTQFQK